MLIPLPDSYKRFVLLLFLWLNAAATVRAQLPIFYDSSENTQRYPAPKYLMHVVQGLQQPELRAIPDPPEHLTFALLTDVNGAIRDVMLGTPLKEPYAALLKNMLRKGPAVQPYLYKGQPVPAVIPVALNWKKALQTEGSSPAQVEAVREISVVQMPGVAGGVYSVEKALKPLRRRLQNDLAGQPLQLELAVDAKGRVEFWEATNLKDAALAAKVKELLTKQAQGLGIPLVFAGIKFPSRVLFPYSLP